MLPKAPLIILDTETGGLNADRAPLLSIGLVHAMDDKLGDQLSIRFVPPKDTWLEVPIHADQLKGKHDKTIECWLNLTTGESVKPQAEKPARFITAIAAEVNGFAKASETLPGWDMTTIGSWGTDDYESGIIRIADWAKMHQANAVLGHNVTFDNKFLVAWVPDLLPALPLEWACTQLVYKKAFLNGATKGSSVGAICKVAGIQPEGILHTELGDCGATFEIWRWLRAKGY
jgi:DNA polymerase III epsilon subunit-like protein